MAARPARTGLDHLTVVPANFEPEPEPEPTGRADREPKAEYTTAE